MSKNKELSRVEKEIDNFPDKIDQLLHHLNKVN